MDRASEILRIVDHEISNQLTVLGSLAHLLEGRWDRLDDDERREAVLRIVRLTDGLGGLMRNLRLLTGGESPGVRLAVRRHERPSVTFAEAVDDIRPLVRAHALEVDVADDLPAVDIDTAALRQVLANLVANAVRYAPEGTCISVRVHRSDGGVRLVVEDEGPGVPEDRREAVFEKFVQLDRSSEGMGLGLFISRWLVQGMGGRAWIEAADGGGARVVVALPAAESPAGSTAAG